MPVAFVDGLSFKTPSGRLKFFDLAAIVRGIMGVECFLETGLVLLAQVPSAPVDTDIDPADLGSYFLGFGLVLFVLGLAIIITYRTLYPKKDEPDKVRKAAPMDLGFDTTRRAEGIPAAAQPASQGSAPSVVGGFVAGAPAPDPENKRGPEHNVLLAINGQQAGPYTRDQVVEMVVTGRIAASTLYWTPGKEGWEPASRL